MRPLRFLLLVMAPIVGAQAQRVEIKGTFPELRLTQILEIPESAIDAKRIVAITSAPDNSIYVADGGQSTISAFSASGQRSASIGRSGGGPGEFAAITSLGWMHDTLVVMDKRARRLTLFTGTGKFLSTIPWPDATSFGLPETIFTSGGRAWVGIRKLGPMVTNGIGGRGASFVEHGVAPIGRGTVGAAVPAFVDARPDPVGTDCLAAGNREIKLFDPPFPDYGAIRGLTTDGRFVVAERDSTLVRILHPDAGKAPLTLFRAASTSVVTDAMWDSLNTEYLAFARTQTTPRCAPPVVRPALAPNVRALQVDEQDRIWLETTRRGFSEMVVFALNGAPVGIFRLPSRDRSVGWWVRNDRLHIVYADADGLQTVRVYTVGRKA